VRSSAHDRAGRNPKPKARSPTKSQSPLEGPLAALAAYRRDVILEAVATSAKELLRSHDLRRSLVNVLENVGKATGADRVHILEIDPASPREQGRIREHYLWTAPDISTPPLFGNAKGKAGHELGLGSWLVKFMRGEPIFGAVKDFTPAVRRFFEFGGVKSTAAVPIFVDGQWWGLIGFDACRSEREWAPSEVDTLKTLAELIGAAVERTSHLKSLADASHIVENSPTILYRLGPQPPFPLVFLSQNIHRYGYDAEELLAAPNRWPELIESSDLAAVFASIKSIVAGNAEHARTEFRFKKPDGSQVWFDGEGRALRDTNGQLVAIEGILTDVTERKHSESKLSFSHILLTTAIEGSPDAILVVDKNDRIIMFNQRFIELWEISPEMIRAAIDEPILKVVAARMKNESEFVAHVRYLYDHPEIQSCEELELKDGRVIERHSGSLYDQQKEYLGRVWFFRNITEKKRAAEKIAALARTDTLTGLANRAAFLDRLNLEFARARRGGNDFAVLYLDLDHFKDVNDTLGHPLGDALLRAVAERLTSCVRETDMVARFGGDEFAVLQDNLPDVGGAEQLAVKIGAALSEPFTIEGNRVQTSVSIGIVPYRADIDDADAMMGKADLALYRAKDEGRNRYRFHVTDLDRQVWERVVIGHDLRRAVEHGEFALHYQPQVALASGAIVGLEALIRWNHPSRGLLLPAAFIPIAETTGSIVAVGQWVIEESCRQIKRWRDEGINAPVVAVNLSAAQFKLASGLDRILADNLARFAVAPGQLELELSETALMETREKHSQALKRLREMGLRLAIDDFGTGYSSLDYLRSFHVCRLKIDERFIGEVATKADDAAIVRAIIGLARELSIEVVAEGVETAAQRAFLISAGCQLAQGHYFGKPVPVIAATALLRRNRLFAEA
jgi:diguanylate cyclase (GGDEF)-like protein/PAS domain S-box-containing protein